MITNHTELAVPIGRIENQIYLIRGEKVMVDADLAELYQVLTKNLNKAVSRNIERFPHDFMFQLTKEEFENLRFQFGTSSSGYGGRRYAPFVFTEHGVAMLSSVLRSARAVEMNILIVRAFIRLRELVAGHKDLADRIEKLETHQTQHASVINILAEEIDNLKMPPAGPPRKRIGFVAIPKENSRNQPHATF
ncbi:MAG: ORF6N domain-containing protein [Bryobacteraceae bacterium]